MRKILYLDNSATTSILPEVQEKMLLYLTEEFGNPTAKYYSLAENANHAITEARNHVSELLNCKQNEIIFTSGSTESNNTVLKGVSDYYKNQGNHIITTKAEHLSILNTCKYLEDRGFKVTYLDVDKYGRVDPFTLKKQITENTILVSIIWGNNELGSLNNIYELSKICNEKNIFFHTDATQVIGKINVDLNKLNFIDFLSLSAHKMHGPKGTGALYIKSDEMGNLINFTPLMHGGGQEDDFRSGTHAVHNIVGFGEAAKILKKNLDTNITKLIHLENKTKTILVEKFEKHIEFNSDTSNKIPGIINFRFHNVNNQILLKEISPIIAASTGSSCSTTKPSHVLKAIGLSDAAIRESIRFSISPYTDLEDINILQKL